MGFWLSCALGLRRLLFAGLLYITILRQGAQCQHSWRIGKRMSAFVDPPGTQWGAYPVQGGASSHYGPQPLPVAPEIEFVDGTKREIGNGHHWISSWRIGKRGGSFRLGKRAPSFRLGKRAPSFRLGKKSLDDAEDYDGLSSFDTGDVGPESEKRAPSFRLGKRGPSFRLGKRGPSFRLGKRAPSFRLGKKSLDDDDEDDNSIYYDADDWDVDKRGPSFRLGKRAPSFRLGKRAPSFRLGKRAPSFRLGKRAPSFRLGKRAPSFRLGKRAPSFRLGKRAPSFRLGKRGPSFRLGKRGPSFRIGRRSDDPGDDYNEVSDDYAEPVLLSDDELAELQAVSDLDEVKEILRSMLLSGREEESALEESAADPADAEVSTADSSADPLAAADNPNPNGVSFDQDSADSTDSEGPASDDDGLKE